MNVHERSTVDGRIPAPVGNILVAMKQWDYNGIIRG